MKLVEIIDTLEHQIKTPRRCGWPKKEKCVWIVCHLFPCEGVAAPPRKLNSEASVTAFEVTNKIALFVLATQRT